MLSSNDGAWEYEVEKPALHLFKLHCKIRNVTATLEGHKMVKECTYHVNTSKEKIFNASMFRRRCYW